MTNSIINSILFLLESSILSSFASSPLNPLSELNNNEANLHSSMQEELITTSLAFSLCLRNNN